MPDKNVPSHDLIPQHRLLSREEGEKVLEEFRVGRQQIPRIRVKDAALAGAGAKAGQIVEVERHDGSKNYRLVTE